MANFCMKCGGALDGAASFCKQCGNPVSPGQQPPAGNPAPQHVAPLPPAKGSPVIMYALIAFFVLVALGMAGAVGTYYYAKSKIHDKMAELKEKTGVDVGAALENARQSRPSSQERDGCALLSKQEAERILGIALTRTDGSPKGGSSEEHCDYYADPSVTQASRDDLARRFQALAKSDSNQPPEKSRELESLVKGFGASANDGSTWILQITIYRGDGQLATTAFNAGSVLMGMKPESVSGPWDEAKLGPLNSTLTVRKGKDGFMIDLRQLQDGREKGVELAKAVAGRL